MLKVLLTAMELTASDLRLLVSTAITLGMVIDGIIYVYQILSFQNTIIVPRILTEAYENYSQIKYDESLKYAKCNVLHRLLLSTYTSLILLFVIYVDGLAFCWDNLQMADTSIDIWPVSWSLNTRKNMSFATVVYLLERLLQFPMELCKILLQKHFGIPHASIWSFIKAWIEHFLLLLLAIPLISGLIILIIQQLDSENMHGISRLMFIMSLLYLFWILYPTFIICVIIKFIFKTTSFPNGSCKTRIMALTSRLHYPFKNVYLSTPKGKLASQSNAFFYGFLTYRKLVVFDSLISRKYNEVFVEAIAAHELGHWYLNHSFWLVTINQLIIVLFCSMDIYLKNCQVIYEAFGFRTEASVNSLILPGLLIADEFILNIFGKIAAGLFNGFQRKLEYEADAFAVKQGYLKELKAALVKLDMDNWGFPNYCKIYSLLKCTHPTTVERITYMDSL